MAEAVNEDVVELILIALDAYDLIRYKSVCKSWYSLITSPRFVKRHLNHSYNKDYSNNKLGHRRVTRALLKDSDSFDLFGSSNGLVCMKFYWNMLLVGNPVTREVRQVTYPPHIGALACWGFGYDSSSDDYKVIVGVPTSENRQTSFWSLSLKSNAWRDIGEENYGLFETNVGVLYNGALHWIVHDHNDKLILSYDLSKEEFKEIHLPNKVRLLIQLGIIKECLCVCIVTFFEGVWLMKTYNVKEQWEFVKFTHEDEMNYDIVHTLKLKLHKNDFVLSVFNASKHHLLDYVPSHVFVQSLVSPHDNARRLWRTKWLPHLDETSDFCDKPMIMLKMRREFVFPTDVYGSA